MKIKDLLEQTDVFEGDFYANLNLSSRQTDLTGCPRVVNGDFIVDGIPDDAENEVDLTSVTSLKGAPEKVTGKFAVNHTAITSLEHMPKDLHGRVSVAWNRKLKTLSGMPPKLPENLFAMDCALDSFEGFPTEVNGYVYISGNKFTNLKDIHKHLKKINGKLAVFANPIKSHVLGVLLIDGITEISHHSSEQRWGEILNAAIEKFSDKRKRVMWAQAELIKEFGEKGKALAQL